MGARPTRYVRRVTSSSPQPAEHEPDYRFSLANERTFLAWVRTSLALLAAAFGVVKLVSGGELSSVRRALAVLLAVTGMLAAASSYQRYRSVQRAMRRGQPLPRAIALPVVGAALLVAALLVLVLVIAD